MNLKTKIKIVSMAVTRKTISEKIHEDLGYSSKQSEELFETLLEIIKSALASGEEVLISRFGKFCVKDKRLRRGRNPVTGEEMMLDPRRIVTFRCSERLKDRMKGKP